MKKIALLTLCLILGSFAMAGCSDGGDPFVQRNYTADISEIKEINIDVHDRQIEVSISADGQIHITYFENSKEAYDITLSEENALTMTSTSNKTWTDYIGVKPSAENRKILLQVPDELLDTLTLSTTNEDISLSAMSVTGSIGISSNGGSITFGDLNVGNSFTLTVKNGDITGSIVGSYDDFTIQTETKKGQSNLPDSKDDGEKMLNVSSNNGDVNIVFVNE